MGDSGWFKEKKVMLINGEILEMPPADPLHDMALTLIDAVMRTIFSSGYFIRNQMSLVLGQSIDPIPDLAVVAGSPRDFLQKPATAALVVEVANSSLKFDTGDKASLYASAGIADYWVVDLVNRQLIVFRDPRPDPARPFGFFYANVMAYGAGQSTTPLRAPQASVTVNDLLP